MKIAIELGPGPREDDRPALLLHRVLETLFAGHPEQEFVLFCTPANAALFSQLPQNVECMVLPDEEQFLPRLDSALSRQRPSVLFRSGPGGGRLSVPLSRQVVLVSDLRHEYLWESLAPDELVRRQEALDRVLKAAAAIVTPTEGGRQALRTLGRRRDVFVVTPGAPAVRPEPSEAHLTDEERERLPASEFFLCPASLSPHRNHRRLLQAFERFLRRAGGRFELILTGDPTGWSEVESQLGSLPVRHLGEVHSGLLHRFYRRARAVVLFSLYEPFGLPLLEAFQAGTPVACSYAAGLRDVSGDAALMCDPTDVEAISQALSRIAQDQELRTTLVARGQERLGRCSPERSAEDLFAVCRRVARTADCQSSIVRLGRAVVRRAVARWEHYLARTTLLLKPQLGIHRQYPPRPLVLPERYAAEVPPDPAPVISIVTPSYNQAAFLQQTMESVLGQNYPRLEYIVQDGGSSDGSVVLLQRYAERLTHWESAPDRGQAHAINLGFRHATGEILAFLNSDDLLLPGTLAHVAHYFVRHPDVDVVYGHRIVIDEEGHEVGRCVLPPHDNDFLAWDDFVPQETMFWRRGIWERIGAALDERFHFALDWDLLLRFRQAGARFARLPRFLGAFRTQPDQKSQTLLERYYCESRLLLERSHGRPVLHGEIAEARWPYLRRQAVFQRLYGMGLLRC